MDPLFRKMCVSICTYRPTKAFSYSFLGVHRHLEVPPCLFPRSHGPTSICMPLDTGIALLPTTGLPLLDNSECKHSSVCPPDIFLLAGSSPQPLFYPQFLNSHSTLDPSWDDVLVSAGDLRNWFLAVWLHVTSDGLLCIQLQHMGAVYIAEWTRKIQGS